MSCQHEKGKRHQCPMPMVLADQLTKRNERESFYQNQQV